MRAYAGFLAEKVERYIELRRSLGYTFYKQAGTLRAFVRFVESNELDGPVTRGMALKFVLSFSGPATGRAIRHGVLRRFCEYLTVYDATTEVLDRRTLPRSRAVPPPRILSEAELASLMAACSRISPATPLRGRTLATLIGLLASTGLRSGEALRLDRADVDLAGGVLTIRKTKYIFRGRSGEAIVVSSASKAQNMACARTFRWDCLDLSHVVLVCVSIYCLDRAV